MNNFAKLVTDTPLPQALSERYLSYALSTILSRSLPDVRDGLKPVHRRLLYAMKLLKLDPASMPKKASRVVGDVIGKFHPHGETAIYEALVRLAQDFAVRYPLVDGHGNFGNIDGDNAAAMRYTEARLTPIAEALLEGLDEDAVDFRDTYDGDGEEPVVLPAAFPNLLANGAAGIAVGMATSIPPHNASELCGALHHLIHHPDASHETLLSFIPGPDFPTGGILVEPHASLLEAYTTGRGSFRVRARWEIEKLKSGLYNVIITEIPYQVPKARLIEKTADLLLAKKLPLLADIRDESAETIRIVLEPKSRTVPPEVLMESLFRATDLEVRIPLNMNVVDADGVPGVMSLKQVLQAFLRHRHAVLLRRSKNRLRHIERRLEILRGYLIAYLNLDEVIRIIREEDEPARMMQERWGLTDMQVEAILNMRLRALRKLEELQIKTELEALTQEQRSLLSLLEDDQKQWTTIDREIAALKKRLDADTVFGPRRTILADAPEVTDIPLDAVVEKEPITVLCSAKGWIRAVKGHQIDAQDVKYKEGDEARFSVPCQTTDRLVIFTSLGKSFGLLADRISRGRGHGEPLRLLIDLAPEEEVLYLAPFRGAEEALLITSSDGRGFLVKEQDILAQTKTGRQVMNLADGVTTNTCLPATGDSIAVIGTNRKLLVFPLSEVPFMTRGRGVILQKYRDGTLSDIKIFYKEQGLTWMVGERQRTQTDLLPWLGHRGQAGRLPPAGFPRQNRF